MGNPPESFAADAISAVSRHLGADSADVAFSSCWWSGLLQPEQDRTWQRLKRSPMCWNWLREFVVSALGDPVSYLGGYLQRGQPVYERVHQCVRDSLACLEQQLEGTDKPLVIFAHSLGGGVISNYLWDEQRRAGHVQPREEGRVSREPRPVGATPFQRMEHLTALVTFGCNIPLFLPAEPPVECVRFPSPSLPAHLARIAVWKNVYDESDVLGYPIANIWDNDNGTHIVDMTMNVGAWPLSRSPESHVEYLSDDSFLKFCAGVLRDVLGAAGDTLP